MIPLKISPRILGSGAFLFALAILKTSFFDILSKSQPRAGLIEVSYSWLMAASLLGLCGLFILILGEKGHKMIREPKNKVMNFILLLLALAPGLTAAIWLDLHINGSILKN